MAAGPRQRIAMAQNSDPATLAAIVVWTYGLAIQYGVLRPDDAAVRAIEEAVQIAAGSSRNIALSLAEYTQGLALLSRDDTADRQRGLKLMVQIRDMWLRECVLFLIPVTELWIAQETARRGDRDGAIAVIRKAADDLHYAGSLGCRLGHRHPGGDAAGAWRRGRPGRRPGGDRPVGEPSGNRRLGGTRDHAAATVRPPGPGPWR
jgi:hypothetical protein